VQTGEDLDPFKLPSESQSSVKRSVSKRSGKGSKKGKAPEPGLSEDGNPAVVDPEPDDVQESGVDLGNLLKCLATAKESILAAECCVSILSSDRLPKQVRIHDGNRGQFDNAFSGLFGRINLDLLQRCKKPAQQDCVPVR